MKPWEVSLKSFVNRHSSSVSLLYSFSDHKADTAANSDVSKVKAETKAIKVKVKMVSIK
jgi:hypothetical protein